MLYPAIGHCARSSINTFAVCLVAEACLTLCDPMDCSPPGSTVLWISRARILEWVAISFDDEIPVHVPAKEEPKKQKRGKQTKLIFD